MAEEAVGPSVLLSAWKRGMERSSWACSRNTGAQKKSINGLFLMWYENPSSLSNKKRTDLLPSVRFSTRFVNIF